MRIKRALNVLPSLLGEPNLLFFDDVYDDFFAFTAI
jgi:hypothetical protein